jgi:ferric-dicitrate binding protein FerR (iron transport regulator)
MAARKRAAKAGKAAMAARENPYIQRLAQDAELRENIQNAFQQTRKAYSRLANGKAPAKALVEDRKLQKELREAAMSLRDVGTALKEGPKRRRRRRPGRALLLLVVGGGLALALSEGLRKKVLDALFGAEEEFDYTSTTTPSPAPETAAA